MSRNERSLLPNFMKDKDKDKDIKTSLPDLGKLIERRLSLLRTLAESLESSSLALGRNDAEAIARGAAHQAELCLQWSRLEDDLRRQAVRQTQTWKLTLPASSAANDSPPAPNTARLQSEWEALSTRIRYLTRVHWSLLRHMERSLAVVNRLVQSCAATYTAAPGLLGSGVRLDVRRDAGPDF